MKYTKMQLFATSSFFLKENSQNCFSITAYQRFLCGAKRDAAKARDSGAETPTQGQALHAKSDSQGLAAVSSRCARVHHTRRFAACDALAPL